MKAAYYETTGGPEVIRYGEQPTPEVKPGEVLVRVKAAALNPIDTYIRAGAVPMPHPTPFIPGCDFAGVVEGVGSAVKRFRVRDRVWGSNQGLVGRQGTFAEYAAVAEEFCYASPAGVADSDLAAGALTGITAHLGLFRWAGLKSGETVFVNGGTGGVGSMVVQMSKAVGARVVATVGSDAKAQLCREWGADRVINYKSEDIVASLRDFLSNRWLDVWYETQREPNLVRTVDLMGRRGRIVIMAGRTAQPIFPVGPFYTRDLSLFGFAMFNALPAEQQRCAEDISRWLAEKKLHPAVGKIFPLSEAVAAHRMQEENTLKQAGTLTGKIVVTP